MNIEVKEWMPLAASLARKMKRQGDDLEDVTSTAYVGLVKAAKAYSAQVGSFQAFATASIRNEILNSYRDTSVVDYGEDMDTILSSDPDGEGSMIIAEQAKNNLDKIKDALATLTDNQKKVIFGLYLDDPIKTKEGLAIIMHTTTQAVGRTEARAIATIRQHLTEN